MGWLFVFWLSSDGIWLVVAPRRLLPDLMESNDDVGWKLSGCGFVVYNTLMMRFSSIQRGGCIRIVVPDYSGKLLPSTIDPSGKRCVYNFGPRFIQTKRNDIKMCLWVGESEGANIFGTQKSSTMEVWKLQNVSTIHEVSLMRTDIRSTFIL